MPTRTPPSDGSPRGQAIARSIAALVDVTAMVFIPTGVLATAAVFFVRKPTIPGGAAVVIALATVAFGISMIAGPAPSPRAHLQDRDETGVAR